MYRPTCINMNIPHNGTITTSIIGMTHVVRMSVARRYMTGQSSSCMFDGRMPSTTSTSFVSQFRIRPVGVVLKNPAVARMMRCRIPRWSLRAAFTEALIRRRMLKPVTRPVYMVKSKHVRRYLARTGAGGGYMGGFGGGGGGSRGSGPPFWPTM